MPEENNLKRRQKLLSEIKSTLANKEESPTKLQVAMERGRNSRAALIQTLGLNIEDFKHDVRSIKTSSKADPKIVDTFSERIKMNGGKVYFARTGEDAIKYVVEICKRIDAKLAIKSKSLTSEEIEFNHGLEQNGTRVVETDLGELVCQVAHEKPSHLVFPAIHKTAVEIADLFSKEYGERITADPQDILQHIRRRLRPIFLSADIGVTGANIGVAETGSIVVETNEGNGRLVSSVPRVHVVIIGMEKIVPQWKDVTNLIGAHTISATGQRMTVYVSIISGHLPLAKKSDGREFHVIILDNGRTKMRGDPVYNDALNCIRCGACMNICPTYGVVGGHVFGYIYPGPIGIPWTANIHGIDNAEFSHLCVACGLCKEICPVDINIPFMIAKVKQEEVRKNGQLFVNSFFVASDRVAKVASATAPLSNWMIKSKFARALMERFVGVDRRRTLPEFTSNTLRKRFKSLARDRKGGTAGKVVFFPDLYAEYNDSELGIRAISLLQRLGYEVILPEVKWSGMPYMSYGELDKARKVAEYNLGVLGKYAQEGIPIVSTEPTAIYMLREVYPELQQGENSSKVAEMSQGFFQFVEPRIDGNSELRQHEKIHGVVGFHIPCHERALTSGRPAVRFLQKAGYSVKVVENGTCCGMAGTFGMKKGVLGYELSMAVGEDLFKRFRASNCAIIATESSVCSAQLSDGVGFRVMHPLHMVDF